MTPPELTDEQREMARKISEGDPCDVIGGLTCTVDEETCAEMRRAFKNGDRLRSEIARDAFEFDRDTVWRHALGNCGHEIDEPPAEKLRGDR